MRADPRRAPNLPAQADIKHNAVRAVAGVVGLSIVPSDSDGCPSSRIGRPAALMAPQHPTGAAPSPGVPAEITAPACSFVPNAAGPHHLPSAQSREAHLGHSRTIKRAAWVPWCVEALGDVTEVGTLPHRRSAARCLWLGAAGCRKLTRHRTTSLLPSHRL